MRTSNILTYLTDLEQNNCREWYHAHKEAFRSANEDFENLLQDLILKIGEFDASVLHNRPKDLTFKIVRDLRFGNDKRPYEPSFRAHISSAGKLPIPVGYYISIGPGNRSFMGGGLFAPMFKDATMMIRDYITLHGEQFMDILTNNSFASNFTVQGEALKKVPAGYDPLHPMAEYLKYKSWYVEYPLSDEILLAEDTFIDLAAEKFKLMKPFNDYLNRGLAEFKMPVRG